MEKKPAPVGKYPITPWKFNIAPEKWWLEDEFPFGKVTFRAMLNFKGVFTGFYTSQVVGLGSSSANSRIYGCNITIAISVTWPDLWLFQFLWCTKPLLGRWLLIHHFRPLKNACFLIFDRIISLKWSWVFHLGQQTIRTMWRPPPNPPAKSSWGLGNTMEYCTHSPLDAEKNKQNNSGHVKPARLQDDLPQKNPFRSKTCVKKHVVVHFWPPLFWRISCRQHANRFFWAQKHFTSSWRIWTMVKLWDLSSVDFWGFLWLLFFSLMKISPTCTEV